MKLSVRLATVRPGQSRVVVVMQKAGRPPHCAWHPTNALRTDDAVQLAAFFCETAEALGWETELVRERRIRGRRACSHPTTRR